MTQKEFVSLMTGNQNGIEANPSSFTSNPAAGEVQERRPVDYVSWYDAIVYCNLLSIRNGLTPCYTIKGSTDPAAWGTSPGSTSAEDYTDWESVTLPAPYRGGMGICRPGRQSGGQQLGQHIQW